MNGRLLIAFILFSSTLVQAGDSRELVELPDMMRVHMLGNMRGHLMTLGQAQGMLAAERWSDAAQLIELNLGMSSLEKHDASHMAAFMPEGMRSAGTRMHETASRLARTLETGDATATYAGFGELIERCQDCHGQYRIH